MVYYIYIYIKVYIYIYIYIYIHTYIQYISLSLYIYIYTYMYVLFMSPPGFEVRSPPPTRWSWDGGRRSPASLPSRPSPVIIFD